MLREHKISFLQKATIQHREGMNAAVWWEIHKKFTGSACQRDLTQWRRKRETGPSTYEAKSRHRSSSLQLFKKVGLGDISKLLIYCTVLLLSFSMFECDLWGGVHGYTHPLEWTDLYFIDYTEWIFKKKTACSRDTKIQPTCFCANIK